MRAVRKGGRFVAEQADERLVDQCRGLEGVTGPLVPHERARDAAQVDDDERHQLVERLVVACTHPLQQQV